MAPAVPLVAAVAGYATTAAIGTGIFASVAGFVVSTAISQVGGRLFAKKPKAPSFAQEASGRTEIIRSSVESHKVVYGTARVAGPLVFAHTTSEGRNNDNDLVQGDNVFLHMVIPVAGHEVDSFTAFYLNDLEVAVGGGGYVTTAPYLNDGKSYVRILAFTGADDQAASSDLLAECPGLWTAAHRLRGVAYLYVRLHFNQAVFPTGIPNVSAVVKGRKVYDPRTTLTAWSDNAALCIRDYLTQDFGFGCDDSEVDDDYFTAAANVCDEDVTLASGATQNRYTCDGVVDTAVAPLDNLQSLVTSLAGAVTYVQGKFRCHAAAYDSPAGTITTDMMAGPLRAALRPGRKDLFNAVRGTYVAPDKAWRVTDFPPVANANYEAQDGGERIYKDVELPFTTDAARAQRVAKVLLEKGRQGIRVDVPLNHSALKYAVFDTVQFTDEQLGWSGKVFRIVRFNLACPGPFTATLQEESAASYDWDGGEARGIDAAPDTNLPDPFTVGPPQEVAAASGTDHLLLAGDGTVVSRVRLTWAASTNAFVLSGGQAQTQFKKQSETQWQDGPTTPGDATQTYLTGVDDGEAYQLRVRFRNSLGVASEWTPISHTVVGKTEPPADVSSFAIEGTRLSWSGVGDVDLAGYRIRYQPGTYRSWGEALPTHGGLLTSAPFDLPVIPSGQVTLMVKAVDTSGNESLNPAYIVTDFGDPLVANVVEEIDLKALGWPGATDPYRDPNSQLLDGGTIDGSDNLVADSTALMWGVDPSAAMWSAMSDSEMWRAASYSAMYYLDRILVNAALAGSRMTISAAIQGDPWAIYYRENSPVLMWSVDPSALMWSPGSGVIDDMWDTPPYQPWPGEIIARNSTYDFLIYTGPGGTQGVVSELTFVIDAPDVEESLNDVAISAGGTRLPITKDYQVIRNVQLTVQADGGAAISVRYEDKDASLGPLVKCLDAAGAATAGTIDARIQGH